MASSKVQSRIIYDSTLTGRRISDNYYSLSPLEELWRPDEQPNSMQMNRPS